jgi:dolichol-phosphate mannosyltransferase
MPEPSRRLVSIVVPVLNEAGNVVPLHEAVTATFEPVKDRYDLEFVFTDNRSTDGTWDELVALALRDPRVRAFRFSRNFGFQRSIHTGFSLARGDAAIQIDCDLQDPPGLMLEFLREWEAGHKVVYGVRRARKEGYAITLARRVFYRLIDWLSEDELPHDAGDFRLVDRAVLEQVRLVQDVKPYLRGTLAAIGFAQKGIPYDRASRTRGESKFRLRDLFALALDGILSHSTVPLRVATYTGLVVSVVTFAGIFFYGVRRIFVGATWPPGFATTTLLLLLSLSLNALFIGIIGEYVGRIFHQVRRLPLTIIDARVDRADDAAAGSARPAAAPHAREVQR